MPKTPISIRINSELLAWFKSNAPDGYQKLICTVLEEYRNIKVEHKQIIIGRAQQIFLQFHARCFWHLKKDLEITEERLSLVQNGLRRYGGIEGMRLASTLDPTAPESHPNANH